MNEIVFTPAGLLDLLSQIDEFKDFDIGLTPTIDDKLQLQIGNSIYTIDNNAEIVYVDNEVVEDVSEVNDTTYDNLMSSGQFEDSQPVQSGLIKELAKTLFVGGVVRLTADILKK